MTAPSFYDPRIMLGEARIAGLFSLEQMIRWALSGNGASAGSRRRLFSRAQPLAGDEGALAPLAKRIVLATGIVTLCTHPPIVAEMRAGGRRVRS